MSAGHPQDGEEDVALKLLHTADWHLGRRFKQFASAGEQKLTRARVDVLDSIFGQAAHHRVDAVLCAGDLFDTPLPDEQWWRPLSDRLNAQSPDRPIFLLPGNHDPFVSGSVWDPGHAFRRSLPDFVHVVDCEDFEFVLQEGPTRATLFARPCTSTAGANDPVLAMPARAEGDESIRIAMAHGSTFDMPHAQTNFPISRDAALLRGFDYVAIGDTHSHRLVPPERTKQPTVYPGAPEPTSFEERNPGHVVLVLIRNNRLVRIRPLRVARWTWERKTVTSLHELEALRIRADLADTVLKLTVDMRLPPVEYARAERLLVELQGDAATHAAVGVMELDREQMILDATDIEDAFEDAPDLLKAAARRLRDQMEAGQNVPVAQRALFNLYQLTDKAKRCA